MVGNKEREAEKFRFLGIADVMCENNLAIYSNPCRDAKWDFVPLRVSIQKIRTLIEQRQIIFALQLPDG